MEKTAVSVLTCLVPTAGRVSGHMGYTRVRVVCIQTYTHVSALHKNINSGLLYFLGGIIINWNLQVYLLYLNFFSLDNHIVLG